MTEKSTVISVVLTIAISLFFQVFNKEVTMLVNIIRSNPFEAFVVVGICVVIVILYQVYQGVYKRASS